MFDVTVDFPRMKVAVATRDERIVEIRYLPLSAKSISPRNGLAARAADQLREYLHTPDIKFELPLAVEGTPFQLRLWQALREIPRGRTRTYGDLARELDGEARAVGQACGDNRLPVVIPCHRVIAADGIGGFAHATGGYLLEAKRWLLAHELGADPFELRP